MAKDYSKVASDESVAKAKTALEANGFKVEVVENLEEAKNKVLSLIPAGKEVFTGTSVTLNESGLTEELNESGRYKSARANFATTEDPIKRRQLGSASEYAVGSVHAITEDGQVLIATASGSQIPNYAYGADHIIWVAGTHKVVKDLNEGMDRIDTYSLPLEDKRALVAYGSPSVVSKVLVYRKERNPERVTIILVKQAVGY